LQFVHGYGEYFHLAKRGLVVVGQLDLLYTVVLEGEALQILMQTPDGVSLALDKRDALELIASHVEAQKGVTEIVISLEVRYLVPAHVKNSELAIAFFSLAAQCLLDYNTGESVMVQVDFSKLA